MLAAVRHQMLVLNRLGKSNFELIVAGHSENLEQLGVWTSDKRDAVKLFTLLMSSTYCLPWVAAFGIFALNIAKPTSPEFLSSVMVLDGSFCGHLCTVPLVLTSSVVQAYILLCASPVFILWIGQDFFIVLSTAELLDMQA